MAYALKRERWPIAVLMVALAALLAACGASAPAVPDDPTPIGAAAATATPTPSPTPADAEAATATPTPSPTPADAEAATATPTPSPTPADAEAATTALVGPTWQWVAFQDMAGQNSFTLDNPDDYTLTFNADETVRIQADCNRARGTYALENGTLAIMLGSMMLAECGPNSRYVTFLNRLEETATYVVEDEQLFLNLVADSGNLVFDAIEATQVTGTVTYRPRIALPPDAVITVQLQDISLADADAEVIGEQVIQAEGRQAPFAYAISYEPEDIRPNNRYSVAARIEDGDGDLLFTSDTIIPVITDDNPTSNVEIVVQQASP